MNVIRSHQVPVFLSLDNTESQPTVELQLCENDPIISLYSKRSKSE